MTEFDLVIDHFAREIDNLPRVSQSIFFASAARIIYDDHSDAIDELSLASVFEHAYKTITDAATDEGSRTSPFQGQVADALNAINSCSPDKPRFGEFVDLPGHGRTYSSRFHVQFRTVGRIRSPAFCRPGHYGEVRRVATWFRRPGRGTGCGGHESEAGRPCIRMLFASDSISPLLSS